MTSLIDTCARAADELRTVMLWGEDVRRTRATEYRSAIAQQMAEDETGVTFNQARLTSMYSISQLTPAIVDASQRYQTALLAAYREVPERYIDLLNWCDGRVRNAKQAA